MKEILRQMVQNFEMRMHYFTNQIEQKLQVHSTGTVALTHTPPLSLATNHIQPD